MQYGPLSPDDPSFRALCMLLAHDPMYANIPVRRLIEFHELIQRRHTFCAIDGNTLKGAIAWQPMSSEDARRAIGKRAWPADDFVVGDGGSLLLLAFIAPSADQALPFFRRFVSANRGKILVLQRHYASRASRLLWIDRSGRYLGPEL
jgi:hypothetical protein